LFCPKERLTKNPSNNTIKETFLIVLIRFSGCMVESTTKCKGIQHNQDTKLIYFSNRKPPCLKYLSRETLDGAPGQQKS
jgi:hypothetical protein